jgi:hypothetical protein
MRRRLSHGELADFGRAVIDAEDRAHLSACAPVHVTSRFSPAFAAVRPGVAL